MNFSVLMSVYKNDDAEQLLRAIQSVTIDQTLKPDQLVLVKDGPVMEAIDINIQKIQSILNDIGIEFTVISKDVNAGLAAALNTGLEYCKYDYVARMDADDISLPHRFELQFDYLSNHQEISILGTSINEFEDENEDSNQFRLTPCDHNKIVDMMKTRNAMNHMTVVYRKSDVLKLGGYSENFGKLEDYKLWIDAIIAGFQLHNLPDVLVRARVGNGFIERRSSTREIQDWDMLQSYLKNAKLIGNFKAIKNKLYIRIFIYMPSWIKRIAYKMILRKKTKL